MKIYALIGLLIMSAITSAEVEPFGKTPAEAEMCAKRVDSRRDKNRNWGHMHHYCNGLRFYDRAVRDRRNGVAPHFNINNSLTNFAYVLTHTTQDFYMRPEVMIMKGRTLEFAKKEFEAAELYNGALKLNPNFMMAYAALGNFYAKTGNKQQALKVFEEGLRRSPKNRYLRSRYKALGGNPIVDSE